MVCENECITKYSCYPPNEPKDGAVFSPFVRLNVKGKEYTVGNESTLSDAHKTVIKSFEYGLGVGSAGGMAKFELVSEGGESYVEFIKALNKTANKAPEDTQGTFFTFGWIIRKCDGTIEKDETPEIYLMIKKAQSNHDGGCIKITIECQDMMSRHFERRIEGNFGSDDNKIPLKDAILEIFSKNDPVLPVKFEASSSPVSSPGNVSPPNSNNINPGGELCFKYGEECKGPRAKWPGDQQNALGVVRKWLAGEVTTTNKGTICQYNVTVPELVIAEDPLPGCNEHDSCLKWLGTYVVNGGNCTDVISFTPSVDWILNNNNAGGTPPSGDSADAGETAEPMCPGMEKVGPQNQQPIAHYNRDNTSPKDTARKNQEATAAQHRANKDYEIKAGVEAELKIIGDTTFFNPVLLRGSYISIVLINPLNIEDCTWISKSTCNQVLSNKRWLILGVSHQIEAGKFNTTIKVKLPVPNADLEQGVGLGGEGMVFDNDGGQPQESL